MEKRGMAFVLAVGLVLGLGRGGSAEAGLGKDGFHLDRDRLRFDLGTEISHIRYAEPNFMKDKGYMYGVFGAVTYRTETAQQITSWRDFFSGANPLNVFRLEGKFSYGTVDYESEGTGTLDDIPDYMLEFRGLTGFDAFPIPALRLTPYIGFGYRYLNDDSGGETTSTGHFGYERESNYFYLPVGLEAFMKNKAGWGLGITVEYDVFLDGEQKSHLGDAVAGLNTVKNDQNSGYGIRGSLKLVKETQKVSFYLEPFIRYWKIDDSEISTVTYSGVIVGYGKEPENNSTEYGVKFGLQF